MTKTQRMIFIMFAADSGMRGRALPISVQVRYSNTI